MRYKLVLSYDGTPFCGWQSQPNGMSIQDALESAVFKLFGEHTAVVGSGRTDAGVHALGQVAHFDCEKKLDDKNVVGGLNAYLPREIRVLSGGVAPSDFHARISAVDKRYMYLLYEGEYLPVLEKRAWCLGFAPDMSAMTDEAQKLIGTHDFSTFAASGSSAKTFVRNVISAEFVRDGKFIMFFIRANGFLYNMVRIITAQLIKIGRGEKIDMDELISARDRNRAKEIAPPYGLYLYDVNYGEV